MNGQSNSNLVIARPSAVWRVSCYQDVHLDQDLHHDSISPPPTQVTPHHHRRVCLCHFPHLSHSPLLQNVLSYPAYPSLASKTSGSESTFVVMTCTRALCLCLLPLSVLWISRVPPSRDTNAPPPPPPRRLCHPPTSHARASHALKRCSCSVDAMAISE